MGNDATHILKTVIGANLRAGARDSFQMGEQVAVWTPSKKGWSSGFRFLSDLGRNVIIERGAKVCKVPRQRLQKNGSVETNTDLVDNAPPTTERNKSDKRTTNLDVGESDNVSEADDAPLIQSTTSRKYHLRSTRKEGGYLGLVELQSHFYRT